MTLPARIADLTTAVADLRTLLANCDSDLAAADPDSYQIARLREEAINALGAFGSTSGEPT
jgi:hypothetical protein